MCIIPVLMHAGEKESLRALILSEEKAWFRAKMVLLLEKVKKCKKVSVFFGGGGKNLYLYTV